MFYRSLLISLVLALSTGCSSPSLETSNPVHSQPILEIFQSADGTYQISGNSLLFRLYDDGFAQFEIADPTAMSDGRLHRIEEVKTVKQLYLNEKEMLEIRDLVKSGEMMKVEPVYQMKCCCTDASLNLAIWVRYETIDRTISLRGFCDLVQIENPKEQYAPNFPKVVSELIGTVHNFRIKYGLS